MEAVTTFYNKIEDLDKIDWKLIQSWNWGKTSDDLDRLRRKQAEFLVHRFFPWDWIEAIGVHDIEIRNKAIAIIKNTLHKPLVKVMPKWYYKSKVRP